MDTAERLVKSTHVPKCWNCKHLRFGRQTRRFHCPVRHMSMPRNFIPFYECSEHCLCSMKGLAKRTKAGWSGVVPAKVVIERYTPKQSYLARRKDVGEILARSQTVQWNVH